VSAAATTPVAVAAGANHLHEVLTGAMAAQYGALPLIPLPQEEDLLIKFVHQMGAVLAPHGVYRRDRVIVLPDDEVARLNIMEPEVFCSWSQNHVVTYKMRYDKNGEPFTSYKDMPTEVAKKVLVSPSFFPYVPKIDEVFPIPMPGDDGDGVRLLEPGFEGGRFTFDF
jgi:hypothetical protein